MFQSALASVRTNGLNQAAHETVDPHLHPLFRTNFASDSVLHSFKTLDGSVPSRKFWNLEQAQDRLNSTSTVSFSLKPLENRDWKLAKSDAKKRLKGVDPYAPDPRPISEARARLSDEARASLLGASDSAPDLGASRDSPKDTGEKPPLKRADKYYQALLKAEKVRNETWRREAWEEYTRRADRAAAKAKKKVLKAEIQVDTGEVKSDSDSSAETELDEDENDELEDPGPLRPYPGLLKVEVEVVVLRAPGNDKSETESSVDSATHTPSSRSEKSEDEDDGIDWAKELQELQEEMDAKDKEKKKKGGNGEDSDDEKDGDSLPEGLEVRTIGNVYDNSDKRTALGLGGTAFFVPEVERYAMAPSLLPPPPRGLGHLQRTGHKRLKLKPRLPLEVSQGRWRDEHPYGCPVEDEYTPGLDQLRSWEEKVRRVELYGTLNKFFNTMPKPDGIRKLPKTDFFEKTLDWELKDSLAWKQYIKRQRLLDVARAERAEKRKADSAQALLEGYQPGKPAAANTEKQAAAEKPAGEQLSAQAKAKESFKGIYKPRPTPLPPHPGAPPLNMHGFQVGKSPPPSPSGPSTRKPGLMTVAPGVRKGAR